MTDKLTSKQHNFVCFKPEIRIIKLNHNQKKELRKEKIICCINSKILGAFRKRPLYRKILLNKIAHINHNLKPKII